MNIAPILFSITNLAQPIVDMITQKKLPQELGYFIKKQKGVIEEKEVWFIIETSSYATEEEANKHIEMNETLRALMSKIK